MLSIQHGKSALIKIFAIISLLAVVIGCGGGGGNSEEAEETTTMKVSLKEAPKDIAMVYKARCVNCHGSELQGRIGANTNLQNVSSRMSAEHIARQIEQGEGLMPAFADQLSFEEIQGLADWLAGVR